MMLNQDDPGIYKPKPKGKRFYIIVALVVLSVICLVVGIVLMAVGASKLHKSCDSVSSTGQTKLSDKEQFCGFSDEAKRAGIDKFMSKVQKTYYELHPFVVFEDPLVKNNPDRAAAVKRVQNEFTAYDLSPAMVKKRTDTAWKLLKELNDLKVDQDKLKPRERKAILQMKHYLKLVFGTPYEANYYSGDWMLGPDIFCYRSICRIGSNLQQAMRWLKPKTLEDVKIIKSKLMTHKQAVETYIGNLKMGVRKGMVRNVKACESGMYRIGRAFYNISRQHEAGVLNESYTQEMLSKDFYSDITQDMKDEWKKSNNGKTVQDSIKEYLIEYLGKPVVEMLRYIKEDHLTHCVNSSVSSGLASLPLKFVYTNGVKNASWPTDPSLPETDQKLDGKKSYAQILPYFTTNEATPAEVHQLGYDMLAVLYPQAVQVAKEVTNITDNATAIKTFRDKLKSQEMYFNEDPFPANEMGDEAFEKCSNMEDAEKNCPKRWEALQKWFKEARMVMSMLAPKIVKMFYYTGPKDTAPNCPVDLRPDLNPTSGIQSYDGSTKDCKTTAFYNIPFFLKDLGPRYSEWSINAHESRPGHHIQIQGNRENFQDDCGGPLAWLNSKVYYTAFLEGWALYAENPLIAEDTDIYKNEPMQRYGMLKWQIWRAIRLIVDTGLHYTGMTRAEAIKLFDEKAWDNTDFTEKEVTRYQSFYGQATAYMIGQIDIKKSRKYATDNLKEKFDIKEFHYQVLSQGSSPLAYLSDHTKRYVACKKDPTKTGCDEILNPPKMGGKSTGNDDDQNHITAYA